MIPWITPLRRVRLVAATLALAGFVSWAWSLTPIRIQSRFQMNRAISIGELTPPLASITQAEPLRLLTLESNNPLRLLSDTQHGSLTNRTALGVVGLTSEQKQFLLQLKTPQLSDRPIAINSTKSANKWQWILESRPKPKPTVDQLTQDIASAPHAVLQDVHPGAAQFGKAFDADSNRRALVAISQAFKGIAEFDNPSRPVTLADIRNRAEAADTTRELVAAVVEKEVRSARLGVDGARYRTALLSFMDEPELGMSGSRMLRYEITAEVEDRLMAGLKRLRAGDQQGLGDGIWARYVKNTQPSLGIQSMSVEPFGDVRIKLNTPEFALITSHVPVRAIARAILGNPWQPDVAKLIPAD